MAELSVRGDTLHLELSAWERLFGLLRPLNLPLSAVTDVEVAEDAVGLIHGFKVGTGLPGYKLGTFTSAGSKTIAIAKAGVPGVRVRLEGGPCDELIVSQPDAHSAVAALRAHLPGGPPPAGRP